MAWQAGERAGGERARGRTAAAREGACHAARRRETGARGNHAAALLPRLAVTARQLSTPPVGEEVGRVAHLGHLGCDDVAASGAFRGGQRAADAALVAFDVAGYARRRNQVLPAAEEHPWPWLQRPAGGSVASLSQWNRG